ncbi:MAG: LLM class F420-dependent oxidoreductase, partial [Pseudomonadota bacterium]
PHPPILLGGETDHTLKRVVEYCDGWFPRPRSGFEAATALDRLTRMAESMKRDPATLTITVFGAPPEAPALASYEKVGIQNALLAIPDLTRDEILRHLDTIAPLAKAHA